MSDYFKEVFIEKKPTRSEWFRCYILSAVFGGLGLALIVGGFFLWTILFFFAIPCFILVWFWKQLGSKVYEYVYVNADIEVAVLRGTRKRKVLADLDRHKLESVRRGTDRRAYKGKRDVFDYTSGQEGVPFWEFRYYGMRDVMIILMEMPDEIISDLQRRNPKVFFN